MTGPVIFITGAERSGISMIASVVWLCGANAGFDPAQRFDGRGNFENPAVKRSMFDPVFRGMSCDRNGWDPLPTTDRCKEIAEVIGATWARRFAKIVDLENGPVMVASTSNTILWPLWQKAFPDAKWVIVRRRDECIVRSCLKSGYMRAFSTSDEWRSWVQEYKRRFSEITEAKCHVWQIWPEWMVNGKLGEIKRMVEWLGLSWDSESVADMIAPMLWKTGVFSVTEEE